MDELSQIQNNQDITPKNAEPTQVSSLEKDISETNYFKVKWLTATLHFIKNNSQHVLVYPEVPPGKMDFIETLIIHKNITSEDQLKPLLASIWEAMTIYQLKYEFHFNSIKKDNGAVSNSNIRQDNMKSNELLMPSGGFKSKIIREKLKIISDVPIKFVLDSLQRVVDFLKDILSLSIIFKDVNKNECTFLMNVKSLLKNRCALMSELSAPINDLLNEIASHQNHDFNLSLKEDRFDKNKNKRNVTILKIPKFSKQVIRRDKKINKRNKESTQSNSGSGDRLLNTLASSTKDGEFKRPLSVDGHSLSSSMESLTVSISSKSDNREVSIERRATSESPLNINFKSGGILDDQGVETSTAKKNCQKTKHRGRSRDKLGPMKTKLIEAMSVPLESSKGLRMMLLMGWKGGALGARGDGITEPIMPDLETVSGVGLGHKQQCRPEKPKKKPRKGSGESSQNEANDSNTPVLDAITKTRMGILQGILELVESFDEKTHFYYDRTLLKREIKFLKPAIIHFNARKMFKLLHTNTERKMLEDINDAMIGNPEVLLHVKISSNKREIEIIKTSDNVTFDEPIYNDRFVRCNKDLNANYAEWSTMSDYCEKVTSQLSVLKFMNSMEPMETYNVTSKLKYRSKAFKLMVLGEILNFLEGKELNRIFYIETEIFKIDVTALRKYIENVNARRKEDFLSEAEESMNERILNKMGNCCLTLDYNQNQQLMRVSKVFPMKTASNPPPISTPLRENSAIPIEDVTKNSTTDQNENSQTEMNTADKVFNNLELLTALSDSTEEEVLEDEYGSIEKGIKEINDQILANEEIDIDKIKHISHGTFDRNEDLLDDLLSDQELSNVEKDIDKVPSAIQISDGILNRNKKSPDKLLNDQVLSNVEMDIDNVTQKSNGTSDRNRELPDKLVNDQVLTNVEINIDNATQTSNDTFNRNEDLPDKSLTLLKDIENLEKSIIGRHMNSVIEPCSSKLLSKETKNNLTKNPNKRISYKNIGIICSDPNVVTDIKEVQKLLSDAIDKCENVLPLLQYHGINNNQLVYSCYNEHTYTWIKDVLCDKFVLSDISINPKNTYRLQMKVNNFNGDIQNLLYKIFLYNPDLDIGTWTIGEEVVTDNFTLLDFDVNGDSLEYINQRDFSLFAGVDKVQCYVKD